MGEPSDLTAVWHPLFVGDDPGWKAFRAAAREDCSFDLVIKTQVEEGPFNFWNLCPDCLPVNGAVYGQVLQPHGWGPGWDTIVVSYQAHLYFAVRFDESGYRCLFQLSTRVLAQTLIYGRLWSYIPGLLSVHRGILL